MQENKRGILKDLYPFKVLLEPAKTFREAGKSGWGWPLGIYALSMAAAALLLAYLPPQFITESFEGIALPRGRGFTFYLLVSLPAGFLFNLFICALLLGFSGFLKAGRLALRLPAAAAAVGAFGILAVAASAPAFPGAAGLAAAAGAAGLAAFTAWRGREIYPAAVKAVLSLSVIALAGDLFSGGAALAGSVKAYAVVQYFFALFSLTWLTKAVSQITGTAPARAAAAAVLALLAAAAFLFLLFNTGLLPGEIFQILMLI